MNKPGTLYIVPTPIGNLGDITIRAIEILKAVDFILCEDTRHSIKLLNHYEIKKPLISYHKFNETKIVQQIIDRLNGGETAALISDAGTPLISDPGQVLIDALIENQIEFFVLPGANAILPSIIYSGFNTVEFTFKGFLPKKKTERKAILSTLHDNTEPYIFYVSPHELKDVLTVISAIIPDRSLSLTKEISKIHELTIRGTASEILEYLPETIKGEYVLTADKKDQDTTTIDLSSVSDEELKTMYQHSEDSSKNKNENIKLLAKKLGVSKRDLYQRISFIDLKD